MPHESALAPGEDASLHSNKYSLLILLAGSLTMAGAAGFARNTFPLLLPDMRIALQSTYGNMGLLATMNNGGYVVSYFLPQLLIRLGPDAWRYGWIVLGALAILTFVPLPVAPYLAAVLGGLTLTAGMVVTVALLGDALGARLAAPAFGFLSIFFNLGQVLSPSISGAIFDATGSFASSLIAATASGFMAATLCLFLRVKGPARGF